MQLSLRMRKLSSGPLLSIHFNNLLADSEGPDQTSRMRRLIWTFSVRLYPKTHFWMALHTFLLAFLLAGRYIYLFGGKSYQKDKEIPEVDYYDVKKRKWHTVFNLPSKYSYANVDCVKLCISVQNREFSFNDVQLYDNWILW